MTSKPDTIPIARPVTGEEEAAAARRCILSGWVTQGPEVAAFERELAERVGAPHACAVSSGTTALHLALLALGVGPGDEVVTVSHSYIATANAVRYCGATPVFVDVDPATYNLDPGLLEAAFGPTTKAVLAVHQMGMPCDLARILPLAAAHGVPVVEDAACAIGSELLWDGRFEPIGRPHADIACFSFHPRKVITTGDGGMLTTANPDWDAQFRLLRQHAMTVPEASHATRGVLSESFPTVGYNYRMTDIQAAVGREQLKRLDGIVARRRELAARYRGKLGTSELVEPPHEPAWAKSNWQSYCVRLKGGADQVRVMQHLFDRGIASRQGIACAHLQPAYADLPPRFPLPESERARRECVLLPLYPQMTDADVDRVATTLLEAVAAT